MTTGCAGFLGWCFGWLSCVLTIIAVGGHGMYEEPTPQVKCPQVETSTYGYTEPPRDKRIGHPLPPGPMKPSRWG